MIIDTHAHLYLDEFEKDINEVIERCIKNDIQKIILPNIDYESIKKAENLSSINHNLFLPCIGLHPTSVKNDYKSELEKIFSNNITKYIAIGETGIDLYWDKTFIKEQIISFEYQLELAVQHKLPIIIHSRNSFLETCEVAFNYVSKGIKGVFHCFPGTYDDAKKVIDKGFFLGIGGVLTFKNNQLKEIVEKIPINYILLETDSPFLAPTPYRGKRNEPSYLKFIIEKIAEIKKISFNEVKIITSENAKKLFGIK